MRRASRCPLDLRGPVGTEAQCTAHRHSTGRACRVCRFSLRGPESASADHRRHRGRSRAYPHRRRHTSSSAATKIQFGLLPVRRPTRRQRAERRLRLEADASARSRFCGVCLAADCAEPRQLRERGSVATLRSPREIREVRKVASKEGSVALVVTYSMTNNSTGTRCSTPRLEGGGMVHCLHAGGRPAGCDNFAIVRVPVVTKTFSTDAHPE